MLREDETMEKTVFVERRPQAPSLRFDVAGSGVVRAGSPYRHTVRVVTALPAVETTLNQVTPVTIRGMSLGEEFAGD